MAQRTFTRWPASVKREARQLRKGGMLIREIAARVGAPYPSVQNWLRSPEARKRQNAYLREYMEDAKYDTLYLGRIAECPKCEKQGYVILFWAEYPSGARSFVWWVQHERPRPARKFWHRLAFGKWDGAGIEFSPSSERQFRELVSPGLPEVTDGALIREVPT